MLVGDRVPASRRSARIARVMMAADVVILGILASPELVTVYAIIRFLPEGVLKFLTVLVFETIPGIGKVFAGGDLPRAARMRGEVMLLTWLATTSVGATMLLWNNSFVELWAGICRGASFDAVDRGDGIPNGLDSRRRGLHQFDA